MEMKDRIAHIIEAAGITRSEFARKIKVAPASVTQMCSGRINPSPQTIEMICREFHIDEVWLRTGEGEMHRRESRVEEVAAVLGSAISGNSTARDRLVRALARLPDDAFPLIEKFILDSAALLQEDAPKD